MMFLTFLNHLDLWVLKRFGQTPFVVKNHGTLDPQVDRFEDSEVIPEAATDFVVQQFRGLLIHGDMEQ